MILSQKLLPWFFPVLVAAFLGGLIFSFYLLLRATKYLCSAVWYALFPRKMKVNSKGDLVLTDEDQEDLNKYFEKHKGKFKPRYYESDLYNGDA
jgi:hypothetical protein